MVQHDWALADELGLNITVHVAMDRFGYTKMQVIGLRDMNLLRPNTTYFYGFTQWSELRKAAEAKPGFSERAFHDRMLSWGSPAMKFVRQLAQ